MYIRYSCLILIFIVYAHSLKCRTREHMKQQQDFYNLASNCMKTSINPNQHTSTSGGSSSDFRPKPQSNNRNNHDERQQDNRQQDNRQDRNRINFSANANDMSKNRNMCPDEYYHRNMNSNAYREEPYYQRKEKRDTVTVQKYNRKNSTSAGSKNKSPLEDIGACVIHCIFKEMKMLNSDNKADRLAMTGVMTNRIRDPELKEFIQDSIEECFDIMDTEQFIVDVEEEHCDFSKKLILCLEEKAKRGCEDWEIRDNSTTHTEFNFNKEDEDRTHNENQNTNQNAYFTSNNKFQNRYPSFNTGQRRT